MDFAPFEGWRNTFTVGPWIVFVDGRLWPAHGMSKRDDANDKFWFVYSFTRVCVAIRLNVNLFWISGIRHWICTSHTNTRTQRNCNRGPLNRFTECLLSLSRISVSYTQMFPPGALSKIPQNTEQTLQKLFKHLITQFHFALHRLIKTLAELVDLFAFNHRLNDVESRTSASPHRTLAPRENRFCFCKQMQKLCHVKSFDAHVFI